MKKILLVVLTILIGVACNEQPREKNVQVMPTGIKVIDEAIISDNITLCHLYREYVSQKELYRDVDEGITELISFYDYIFYCALTESIDNENGKVRFSVGDIKTIMWCYYVGFSIVNQYESLAEGLYEYFSINNTILTEEWKQRIDVNSEEYMAEFEALKVVMRKEAELWGFQE